MEISNEACQLYVLWVMLLSLLQLEQLLLEADVGSNYKMDKNLMMACEEVVHAVCPAEDAKGGDGK